MIRFLCTIAAGCAAAQAALVTGQIVDADSRAILPARLYIQSADGKWFFPKSAEKEGSAFELRRQAGVNSKSIEMHTTLSAHPFTVELPPGQYVFRAERGKEYFPAEERVEVRETETKVTLQLRRWIDMARRGWFSGDTHSHRPLTEMTNVMLAEDVNVGFPMTQWVTVDNTSPLKANRVPAPVPRGEVLAIDPTHLIYPLNTEYEIFTTDGKSHTLGAILILGHKTPFDEGVPPVASVAAKARREGALLDLEKHSWPWSIAMVPVMNVDLYELSNNHVWQTEFGYGSWTTNAAGKYMNLEMDAKGFTEWGWIDFGFQTYYALLNAGFRLRPTAGTAAGVHPVPFGFGRVYVKQANGFSYDSWMKALDEGRSFVTTGPMLFVEVNGAKVAGAVEGIRELERIEIVLNGKVAKPVAPANRKSDGVYRSEFKEAVEISGTSWIAVRAFEKNGGRKNLFAHSSPVFLEDPSNPLHPRREEIEYLIGRVQEEIARNRSILSEPALEEYRAALRAYEKVAEAMPQK